MTDHDPSFEGEDQDRLAAEYVLGVLDGEARMRAAKRLAHDPTFRAQVEAWERRLAPLIEEVEPIEPTAGLWERLASSIALASNVTPLKVRPRVWNRIETWRVATGALAAAAASLAIVVAVRPPPPTRVEPTPAAFTSTLATPGGRVLFVALIDPSRARVTVISVGRTESSGRSPELWIVSQGGKPKPVGLLDINRPRAMTAAALLDADRHAVLAVSLEPVGGSPTGAPTGPVIATGALTAL